ncbi:MAG TPA: Hsp70 family protein [Pseudonocardiaceae bacterium]
MSYWLGIDVGTTFTAAAICREEAGPGLLPDVVPLGSHSAAVSSVVYLGEDGQVVVGEAAERRAVTDPDRVVRQFKRRIGDEVPMVIGGAPHSAPEIAAMVVRWVVDRVTEREGGPPQGITITHPASWGIYKIQIMADALHAADLPALTFRTEPEAAAASYSIQERVETGSTIAVYDLGGGTFDAAVVRKTGARTFSVLGVPEGIERLGGADFDDAVFSHVVAGAPALSELDPEAPATLAATARLRRECTEAKEALSSDTEVTIPVLLPGFQSQVRLVRAEFEDLIRPQVVETIEALRRALRSAGVTAEDLDAVLLVGGSSRVPLVAQLVSAELGRPVAIDADPKAAIALGAALSALPAGIDSNSNTDIWAPAGADLPLDAPVPAGAGVHPTAMLAGADFPEWTPGEAPIRPSMTSVPLEVEPAEREWRRARSRRIKRFAAAGLFALVLAGGAASVPFVTSHSGPLPPADAGTPSPVTATTTPANAGNGNATAVPAPVATPTDAAVPVAKAAGGTAARPAPPPAPATTSWTTIWSNPPPSPVPPQPSSVPPQPSSVPPQPSSVPPQPSSVPPKPSSASPTPKG